MCHVKRACPCARVVCGRARCVISTSAYPATLYVLKALLMGPTHPDDDLQAQVNGATEAFINVPGMHLAMFQELLAIDNGTSRAVFSADSVRCTTSTTFLLSFLCLLVCLCVVVLALVLLLWLLLLVLLWIHSRDSRGGARHFLLLLWLVSSQGETRLDRKERFLIASTNRNATLMEQWALLIHRLCGYSSFVSRVSNNEVWSPPVSRSHTHTHTRTHAHTHTRTSLMPLITRLCRVD